MRLLYEGGVHNSARRFFCHSTELVTEHIVMKIVRCVYDGSSPTNWIIDNDALFSKYHRKFEAQVTQKAALAQISNTSSQQITNNNRSSTNTNAQCLTVDKLAMRTRVQRDPSLF
ncbi:hypothetical protein AVEN_194982-1 [Araneus ventricosus]|uniref:Uncharacterized protein n=1 Tax=Araneus ventricosus TaxID=182803 RepID=A0A4Y2RCU2_ARAVE|nr:hypothetical protein AVEN_194982-1 [Araneus ventricosus]